MRLDFFLIQSVIHNSWVSGEKNHKFFFSSIEKIYSKQNHVKVEVGKFSHGSELQIKIQNCCISAKGSSQTL